MTLAAQTARLLRKIQDAAPRVHCITNNVAQNFTANALLAIGARPSMTIDPNELPGFVGSADALLANLGTMDAERRAAISIALEAARRNGRPWVLDPVMVERSESRRAGAVELLQRGPAVVRANAAELTALSNGEADDAAGSVARQAGCVVWQSGAEDIVADGTRHTTLTHGHPLMARVTAMGCASAALCAAFRAVESDSFAAASASALAFGVAGEIAGETARGPGSFSPHFLDALAALDETQLAQWSPAP